MSENAASMDANGPEFNRWLNESARLLSQNKPEEALELLLPLYEVAPTNPDVLINLSGAYILQRKWNRAVTLLNKAVKEHPNNAMLWMNMGAAQLGRLETSGPQQQDKAIVAFQRALQANADTPNAHYSLGLIYKERGELNRASAFFQRALEVNPADRDARFWLDRLAKLMMEEAQNRRKEAEAARLADQALDDPASVDPTEASELAAQLGLDDDFFSADGLEDEISDGDAPADRTGRQE